MSTVIIDGESAAPIGEEQSAVSDAVEVAETIVEKAVELAQQSDANGMDIERIVRAVQAEGNSIRQEMAELRSLVIGSTTATLSAVEELGDEIEENEADEIDDIVEDVADAVEEIAEETAVESEGPEQRTEKKKRNWL